MILARTTAFFVGLAAALVVDACTPLKDDAPVTDAGGSGDDGTLEDASPHDGTLEDASPVHVHTGGGVIDTSFGENGWRAITLGEDASGVTTIPRGIALARADALHRAGDIVVVGSVSDSKHAAFARVTSAGALDTASPGAAIALSDFGEPWQEPQGLAIDGEGRITLVGTVTHAGGAQSGVIVRHLDDTTEDSAFGSSGKIESASNFQAAVALSDGSILVVGAGIDVTADGGAVSRAVVFKLRAADGKRDAAFAGGAPLLVPLPHAAGRHDHASATSVAVDANGRIVVGGVAQCNDTGVAWNECVPFVARVRADGTMDTSFGDGAEGGARSGVVIPPNLLGRYDAVAIDGDHVLAAGRVTGGVTQLCTAARFDAQGKLDAAYGTGGIASFDLALGGPSTEQRCISAVREPDGALTVAGIFKNDDGASSAITRLTPNGKLDTTFGINGGQSWAYPSSKEVQGSYAGITHAADGALLVITEMPTDPAGNMAVLRLTP